MANRFWVGGTANWDATAGTKWATTSGGAGGAAVPTAADDVFLDANSIGNVTMSGSTNCRSLNCTGYTGVLTHPQSTTNRIGDGTAGAGNVALKLSAGMTYSAQRLSTFTFVSTSATQQTITTAGWQMGWTTFSGVGSSYQLTDSWTSQTLAGIIHSNGTLDTNGQSVVLQRLETNVSTARTLTMGSSSITLTDPEAMRATTVTNMTITANTATITCSGAAGQFNSATINWNGASVVFTGSGACGFGSSGNLTFAAVTRTGTALKTDAFVLGGDITCTGTFTVNGTTAINRVLVTSKTLGTARTITAATVATSNTDWRDITGAGAGDWDLSAITGNSGDCGGNTNITFTTGTTQTATGTASFAWSTHGWTSRVPLPQDDVSIPNAFVAGRTITMDMPRVGRDVTFTCTGSPALSSSIYLELYGSLTLAAGMGTINLGTNSLGFFPTGTANVTSAGNSITQTGSITIARGTVSLQDAFSCNSFVTSSLGSLVTNDYAVTCNALVFGPTSAASTQHQFGTSTVTINAMTASNVLLLPSVTSRGGASTATFVIGTASANTRTFNLYGGTIGALTYTVAASSGVLSTVTDGTIDTLNIGSGRTLRIASSTTLTIGTAFNVNGVSGSLTTIESSTAGTPATISKSSGEVSGQYLSIKDSTATGGATFYAIDSTNTSGNSGWNFIASWQPRIINIY